MAFLPLTLCLSEQASLSKAPRACNVADALEQRDFLSIHALGLAEPCADSWKLSKQNPLGNWTILPDANFCIRQNGL